MADTDPAREVMRARISKTLAETMTARDWERMANVNAESAHLWWDICEATAKVLEGALDDLAARTTARDQALAERDALRAELDALRASRPAPLGDKAREALLAAMDFHAKAISTSGPFSDYDRAKSAFFAAMASLTDADLAPDPVVQECVEACMAYDHDIPEWDKPSLIPVGKRVADAGRAARAKGGA